MNQQANRCCHTNGTDKNVNCHDRRIRYNRVHLMYAPTCGKSNQRYIDAHQVGKYDD